MKKFILPLIFALTFLVSCSIGETGDEFKNYFADETTVEENPIGATDDESEMMVYVTPHGKRYHIYSCGSISGHDFSAVSVSKAESMGRTPCHRCNPDYLAHAHNESASAMSYAANIPHGSIYSSGYSSLGVKDSAASSYTVYITPYGKRYHRASCWHIKGHDVTAVDVSKAKSSGRTPCKDCKP